MFHYTESFAKIKHIPPPGGIFCDERVIFMKTAIFYTAGNVSASRFLSQNFRVSPTPAPDVTHLLLPVPSFEADGRIRGGGLLEHILADLPENITVIGGNLNHPLLKGYRCIDLLRDGEYVARNAAITADCAIRVAANALPVVWDGCSVLIIGWGRIGKCLAAQLKAMGADVTVTARKAEDRWILKAMGYGAIDPSKIRTPERYRVIFNTAPAPVMECGPGNAIKIDLASAPGIFGEDVIRAGGLPGKMAPESSGKLIAETIFRLFHGKEEAK